jgi:hypothetical protein
MSALSPNLAATTMAAIDQAYIDWETNGYRPTPPTGYANYFYRIYGWEGVFSLGLEKYGLIFQSSMVPGQYLVAIRGTEDATEWVYNFDWSTTQFPTSGGVDVATGFYDIYTQSQAGQLPPSMQQQLRNWITQTNPKSLIITGHSLGGALASLFAYDLSAGGSTLPITFVSYASPRVGKSNWQSEFNSAFPDALRVYNTEDVVPFAPPSEFVGYEPVGIDWQVEFEPSDWWNWINPDALRTNHSLLNYEFVVNQAVQYTPPIWTGTFPDQSGVTTWTMQSWAPSGTRGAARLEEWSKHIRALKLLSRPTP